MRVHIVDPSAYTPPYDHALCQALADAGVQVELYTSHFPHGLVAEPHGYVRHERFYRLAADISDPRARRAVKLAEHVPDMLGYRRLAQAADVVHFQWLPVQYLDGALLPTNRSAPGARRPLVLTAHDILPREPRPAQRAAQRRLYERFDAVIVHSRDGRERLTRELGVDANRVHVIPHGAFVHLADTSASGSAGDSGAAPRAPGFAEGSGASPPATDAPVVLFFGLLRPYKGLDLLLEAWRGVEGAELWIAGAPRMDVSALDVDQPGVRLIPRFIPDGDLPTYFRRADLVVLPYREIDQSGVLATALAFGKPMLLSDVGGFPEVAATGAARTFPAGDAAALRDALRELLGERAELTAMTAAARAAVAGPYAWGAIARQTIAVYEGLLAR
jgi:glycosyltransferase involved in cell wall biosynthesis